MTDAAAPTTLRSRLRSILPWLGAALLLGWVLYPFLSRPDGRAALASAFSNVSPWAVVAVPLLFAAIMTSDSLAMWRTFGLFRVALSYREALVIRGSTYLLALVNYSVGQGGIVYFVHRERAVPLARAVGITLLIMGINLVALVLLADAGALLSRDPGEKARLLRTILLVLSAGLPAYLALVALRPRFLAERALLAPLFEAGLVGHLRLVLVRLPHIFSLMVSNYVVMLLFGVEVPLLDYLRDMPAVFFVAVLPITVQGLGTQQAVQLYFFARWAPGEPRAQEALIVAASLFWTACGMSLQALTGAVCLRLGGRRMLAQPAAPKG